LLEVLLTDGSNEIMVANKAGKAIRFPEAKVRSMGRSAAGVKAMNIDKEAGDEIVGILVAEPTDEESSILTVSENGMGKRTLINEYRLTNRGGKGVTNLLVNEKTGSVFAVKKVTELDHIMITTKGGIMIRMKVSDVRNMGRATQGVKLINVGKKDSIADVAIIKRDENSPDDEMDEAMNDIDAAFEEGGEKKGTEDAGGESGDQEVKEEAPDADATENDNPAENGPEDSDS